MVAEGKQRKVIAAALHIGEDTVKFHLGNARIKLNVFNTTHAVSVAITSGFIKITTPTVMVS